MSKLTDLLQNKGRGGGGGGGHKANFTTIDEYWKLNEDTGYYTYREQPTYVQVKPGLSFKIPRKILSPRLNPHLPTGESSPVIQLNHHHYLRRGYTPEHLIALQAKSGDERGAAINLELYNAWKKGHPNGT